MIRILSCLLFALTLFILVGCSTTSKNEFSDLRVGMEKAEVVERLGSPFRSEREDGNDTWIYRYYEDTSRFEDKVVIFQNGKVIYSGVPITHESVLKGF